MSQAIADPSELRRFAHQLQQFNNELEERLTALNGQLHNLNATWRDQEHKKFAEEFEQHLRLVARSIENANEYAPFLLRKAQRIEEYLDQR
ncbi:MAG: WXG100 family type VII secretion target [Planctomycetota bacterium]